ncbi:unnamed protein product [Paramecium sonneborni]|uniref:Uncharacterized protein n=1 Tax=Paramecium sonneborni TaxID=65129 RepID=A0A8S1RU85_9CILI|nr:unnamed protein product [Paramecium sonneborni]
MKNTIKNINTRPEYDILFSVVLYINGYQLSKIGDNEYNVTLVII